jgi:ferredoxin-NADP reductase/fatty acid desaturase
MGGSTVLIEAESRAIRRGVPDPRMPLPLVAWPTVVLFFGSFAVWCVVTWGYLARDLTLWVVVPTLSAVSFAMFTVVHECVHHAAGRVTWVNEVFGRLSTIFFTVHATFAPYRYLHIEHHRNTNTAKDIDPDMWVSHGPLWQMPVRWLTLDFRYNGFYLKRIGPRPRSEKLETLIGVAAFWTLLAVCVATGYGWEFCVVFLIPQRIGMVIVSWWFAWLPHHDIHVSAADDNFRATRTRVGMEWLLNPVLLYQNYHAVHHLHPSIPFYRYVEAWQRNEQVYLDADVPLATIWGRELSSSEYRAWRGLTGSYLGESAHDPGAPVGPGEFHRLTVTEVRQLTPDAVSITLDVPSHLRDAFRFTAGQHVVIRRQLDGQDIRRTYSICTSATSEVIRIGVRRLSEGRMSGFLHSIDAGEVLEVSTPRGRFTLEPSPRTRGEYVGIAAGSGITPLISMLATALTVEEQSRFTLLYGNRTVESTMFRDELQMLVRQFEGRLRVVEFRDGEEVTGADLEAGVEPGPISPEYLDRLLVDDLGPGRIDGWFLCGPRPLVESVKEVFAHHGVAPERVHSELFVAATSRPVVTEGDQACTLSASLGAGTVTVQTSPGQTVLGALLASGAPAPYSCMGGACGTCRALVTHGRATMDQNQALEDAEVEAGYVLTCQARPQSSCLAVDYNA